MTPAITRILVPVDFSPHSEHALLYAQALAERLGASIHLVHVVELPAMWGTETYTVDLSTLLAEMTEDAERRMSACRVTVPAPLVVTTAVVVGQPAAIITQVAEDTHAGLVIMGTHGRSGLSHLVMGSVAERVMRTAPCPVMTVRTAGVAEPAVSAASA